jgi:hypothetical protein
VIPWKGTDIVHTEELVRSWRQPGSRGSRPLDHPSGEITLRPSGRLARRYRLLADQANTMGTYPTHTQTGPVRSDLSTLSD